MAHAAVVSLMHTLEQILQHPNPHLNPYDQQEIGCLLKKLSILLDFLEEDSQNSSEQVISVEMKIRDAAYRAEDAIESRICNNVLSQSRSHGQESSLQHRLPVLPISDGHHHTEMQQIIKEFDYIMEDAMNITEGTGQSGHFLPSRPEPSCQSTAVGFDEDLKQVRNRLCNGALRLQIISIVGMGGTGKTTLARNVLNDPFVAYYFHIRAWVTLSPQYRKRELLLSLLDHFVVLTDEIRIERDEKLAERLYKSLKGRRYLIVFDDIWSTSAWDDMKMLFPNDNNIESRIIVTTRLTDVADHVSLSKNHHQMRFLNEEHSWNLFCEKVFGQEICPPELEDIGRTIAKNCQGLPLSIVVIGGLLSNVSKAQDYWEYVAENLSSIIAEKDGKCLEILTLSYKHLPTHLKACFLYMGVFPENHEITISRLVNLWIAEGFLKPRKPKHLEEVAEEYLMELISRNLIFVRRKGSNGKVKSCGIHDLLRELCVRIAHKENFFGVKSRYLHFVPEEAIFTPRLSIHDDASYSPSEEDTTVQSMSRVRSFIYSGWDETQLHSYYYYFGSLLLRVLDMIGLELTRFPEEILQLINLRYIAITCLGKIPPSITLLRNLRTLIVEDPCGIAMELPEDIFDMPQLRHLKVSRASLPPVFSIPFPDTDKHFVLEKLETISKVQDFGMTTHVLEKLPNVKKLGIHCNTTIWHVYDVHLRKLETLKILFDTPTNSTFLRSITSGPRLKKITLERGRIGWEDMTIFGSLPNLEVLKLHEFAFIGSVWAPNCREFLKLKFLRIWETDLEDWRADETHFPSLEHLILWKCSKLAKIPLGIGEIETLEIIETDYSSPPVVQSAENILSDQQSQGNESLQVIFHPTKARIYPLKFGLWEDDSGVIHQQKTKLDTLRWKNLLRHPDNFKAMALTMGRKNHPLSEIDEEMSKFENLETLSKVQDLGMTKHVLEKMPNVKKLGIHYNTTIWHVYDVHLQKLETLKILFESPTNSTFLRSITCAPRLKKITLERGRIGWEDMTIFGLLPNLEVLKLCEFAFIGPVWVPNDGEFLKLKYLDIWETDLEDWRADKTHFPSLEHLVLWQCSKLVEIPLGIGDIETLEIIETDDSSSSVVKSAKDILKDQQNQGNEGLQVIFYPTKARLYPLKSGLQQDDSGVIHQRETKLDLFRQGASQADPTSKSPQEKEPVSEMMVKQLVERFEMLRRR